MVFNAVFNSISVASSAPIHAFTEFLKPDLFLSHWLISHLTIGETVDSGVRRMNPVTMIIISTRKE